MILEIKSTLGYFYPLFADSLFCVPEIESSPIPIKKIKEFKKGIRLFSAGQMPHSIYRLVTGKVRILLNAESNDIHISRLVEPTEVLGLTEALSNIPYEINALAITACTCECISREDLIRFLQDNPEAGLRVAEILGANFQNSYKLFVSQ